VGIRHKPRVLAKALQSGEFDTVLVPINVVTRQALEELLPVAKANDVKMLRKPPSAKTSTNHPPYQPSLLVSMNQNSKRHGKNKDAMAENALRYVLSQDIATVIPGLRAYARSKTQTKTGNAMPDYRSRAETVQLQFRRLLPRLRIMYALPTKHKHSRRFAFPHVV
jgi:aryl-alcohol dehydrogenase-like predicted oxidoreductase